MKKLLVIALMALFTLGTHAQIVSSRSTGITKVSKPSNSWNTLSFEYLPSTLSMDGSSESFTGLALNFTHATSISNSTPLFIEFGLGAQYSTYDKNHLSFNVVSAKVPLNIVYDFAIPNSTISLDPYVGLKFRFNAWGKAEYSYNGRKTSIDLFDSNEGNWKRFQAGMQLGVKARFNNTFFVGIGYGFDFNEIGDNAKVNEVQLSVGLCF
jgi:hypothetical protein